MKAITIHQPWAGLIAIGAKRFETRGWKTNYRGPIAIHAGKKNPHDTINTLPYEAQISLYDAFYNYFDIPAGALNRMTTGSIVATANLVGCHMIYKTIDHGIHISGRGDDVYDAESVIHIDRPELHFGFYEEGRYAWELDDVKMLTEPIPVKGQQGLWNWSA
jgi:hypothetical protein